VVLKGEKYAYVPELYIISFNYQMWLYAFLSVVMIINRTNKMKVIPTDKRQKNKDRYSR
jgi:prenyltransferase beta subunit